jgi:anti-anti-sigma regulatory factor
VQAHTTYSKNKGKVVINGVNKNISNIFVITKLTLVFDVTETREEAVSKLQAA